MEYTRKQWIKILEEIAANREEIIKNQTELDAKKKQARYTRILFITPLILLFTVGPLYILHFIQSGSVPVLSNIFQTLESNISGFHYIYDVGIIALIFMLLYGVFAIQKDNALMYRIGIFKKIYDWVEKKHIGETTENPVKHADIFYAIPEAYRHPKALNQMKQYLVHQKAKTLTDAVMLYRAGADVNAIPNADEVALKSQQSTTAK